MNSIRPAFTLLRAALLGLTLGASGHAAADNHTVAAGDSIVLGSYSEVMGSSCIALRAPILRITQAPRLGRVSIIQTQGVTQGAANCSPISVTLSQIHYQGLQPGLDSVGWEVKYQTPALGTRQADAEITVRPRPLARPKAVQP